MEYKIKKWWDNLSTREKEIIITACFEKDLTELGIYIDKKTGEYRNE